MRKRGMGFVQAAIVLGAVSVMAAAGNGAALAQEQEAASAEEDIVDFDGEEVDGDSSEDLSSEISPIGEEVSSGEAEGTDPMGEDSDPEEELPLIEETENSDAEEDADLSGDAALSGTCGEGVFWKIENGILTISGKGSMSDYTQEDPAPWQEHAEEITEAEIESGVTGIGSYAFLDQENLKVLKLSDTVTAIGDNAFTGCSADLQITM